MEHNITFGVFDHIPIRYSYQSQCFMHAYHEGPNGKDAVWACKKYKGHHVMPKALLASFYKPNAIYTKFCTTYHIYIEILIKLA